MHNIIGENLDPKLPVETAEPHSSGKSDISHWLVLHPGAEEHARILDHLRDSRNEVVTLDPETPISDESLSSSALTAIARRFKFLKRT